MARGIYVNSTLWGEIKLGTGDKLVEFKASEVAASKSVMSLQNTIKMAADDIPVFIHKNRDGSYAMATGKEPLVWPEDDKTIWID